MTTTLECLYEMSDPEVSDPDEMTEYSSSEDDDPTPIARRHARQFSRELLHTRNTLFKIEREDLIRLLVNESWNPKVKVPLSDVLEALKNATGEYWLKSIYSLGLHLKDLYCYLPRHPNLEVDQVQREQDLALANKIYQDEQDAHFQELLVNEFTGINVFRCLNACFTMFL